jgi:hypothetical protein
METLHVTIVTDQSESIIRLLFGFGRISFAPPHDDCQNADAQVWHHKILDRGLCARVA